MSPGVWHALPRHPRAGKPAHVSRSGHSPHAHPRPECGAEAAPFEWTPRTMVLGEPGGMSRWDASLCTRRNSGKTRSRCIARPTANARTRRWPRMWASVAKRYGRVVLEQQVLGHRVLLGAVRPILAVFTPGTKRRAGSRHPTATFPDHLLCRATIHRGKGRAAQLSVGCWGVSASYSNRVASRAGARADDHGRGGCRR
jgi:hypothetical protein